MREEGKDEERKTAGEGRERGTRKARKSRKLFYVSGKQKIILGKASSLEPEAIGRPSRFLKPGKVFPFLLNYGKYNCVPVIIPLPSPIFSLSLPPSLSLLFAFLIFFFFYSLFLSVFYHSLLFFFLSPCLRPNFSSYVLYTQKLFSSLSFSFSRGWINFLGTSHTKRIVLFFFTSFIVSASSVLSFFPEKAKKKNFSWILQIKL